MMGMTTTNRGSQPPTDRLFVYGTLRRGHPSGMASLMGPDAKFLGYARTRGRLEDLGAYPALRRPLDPDEWVSGEVYRLARTDEALARIDAYEGCGPADPHPHEFERIQTDAILIDSGRLERVWVYLWKGASGL